jgi:hypothetical protein
MPLSLILVIISLLNIFYAYKRYHNNAITILSVWVAIYILYVFFVPSIYGVFTDFKSSVSYGINPDHLVLVYFIEIVFILILLPVFYNAPTRKISSMVSRIIPSLSRKSEVYFLLFLSFIVILVYMDQIFTGLASYGRIQQYDANVTHSVVGIFVIPAMVMEPLIAIFMAPGKIATSILLTMPYSQNLHISKFKFKLIKISALLTFILIVAYGISMGVRNLVLVMFILVMISGILQKRYKFTYVFIFGLIAIIAIGPIIGSVYRTFLTQTSSQNLGIVERVSALSEMSFNDSSSESFSGKLWDEFGIRLVDARLSTGLIKFSERDGHVGTGVISNTIYSFIPRYIWNDKPAPRSYDGTHKGLAGFLVWKELTGREWGNWGGYTAASHSWWELSLVGVIINAIIFGLFLRIVIGSTERKGLVGIMLLVYSLNIIHFDSFFMKTIPDMLLFFSRVLPLMVILFFWSRVSRLKI